jgi:hypothetical protein
MAMSPTGRQFKIDVKGLYRPNFWLIRFRPLDDNLFYILAYVPDPPASTDFIIMTHEQMLAEQTTDLARAKVNRPDIGETYSDAGIGWKYAIAYRDQWSALPA